MYLYSYRFSLFNHPEVTQEFILSNKDDKVKQQLCREIALPGYEIIADMPSPRFIKSHLPFSMLPGLLDVGCKVIIKNGKILFIIIIYYNIINLFIINFIIIFYFCNTFLRLFI